MENSPSKLTEALIEVRRKVHAVGKSGTNEFHKYRYAELADFMLALGPYLEDNGLAVTTSITTVDYHNPINTKAGGTLYPCGVQGEMVVRHISGETLTVAIAGYAQNNGDKAIYAAITGARKYGLAQIFNLATTDDPESFGDPDKQGEGRRKSEPKPSAQPPAGQPPGSQPTDIVRQEIHERLLAIYGKENYVANLKRLTEFTTNDGKLVEGVGSLTDKHLSAGRLKVLRDKVSYEHAEWSK